MAFREEFGNHQTSSGTFWLHNVLILQPSSVPHTMQNRIHLEQPEGVAVHHPPIVTPLHSHLQHTSSFGAYRPLSVSEFPRDTLRHLVVHGYQYNRLFQFTKLLSSPMQPASCMPHAQLNRFRISYNFVRLSCHPTRRRPAADHVVVSRSYPREASRLHIFAIN